MSDVDTRNWAGPGSSGPFDPAGVSFTPVSRGLITARLITEAIFVLPPLLIGAVLAVLFSPWWWILAGTMAVIAVWSAWLIPRQVRAIGYAERADDLLIRKGIVFRRLTVVPYGRMQFVDVKAGPLNRRCGIAEIQLHTASATTDASIPGLPPAEADRLRDRLTERGEARLAGL
ncbi:PH domain-containing protein [Georgenia faecalis]|uniref:PH domain-containing protein n=1 Tax=Georgenia faecalis TaxID=2483799 RepID=A0ABV9DC25_9MICO|nr:PH domain-containing protein [Georgenia faecalis]